MQNSNKDIQYIFKNKLTPFKQRPDEMARFLIQRNLKNLVQSITKDINEFTNTTFIKFKALCQLKNLIVLAEHHIQHHLEHIIKILIKAHQKENNQFNDQIRLIFELLGMYIEAGVYIPIVLKILNEEDFKMSSRLVSNTIELFSILLKHETTITLDNHQEYIIKALEDIENAYNENNEIMMAGNALIDTLIGIMGEKAKQYKTKLFSFYLTLQSLPNIPEKIKVNIDMSIQQLAINSGFRNKNELYSALVLDILRNIIETKSYCQWNRNSKERFKFDVIVRNCGAGLNDIMDYVMQIIEYLVQPSQEVEIRIDALAEIEYMIKLPELEPEIMKYSGYLMSKILIPAITWKVGKPQIKIRKAGVICMLQMIQRKLIPQKALLDLIGDIRPLIKSCLNDDWAPDLRFASCCLMEAILAHLSDVLSDIDLKDIYPMLLERLDDSQDMIRIEISKSIANFFKCKQLRMSYSIFEYVLKILFIHLDDQNEDIQMAMFNLLKLGAEIVDHKKVLEEAKISEKRQKFPRKCQELIRYIEENMTALNGKEKQREEERNKKSQIEAIEEEKEK